jgi:Flp pilus assembly pilin Flp
VSKLINKRWVEVRQGGASVVEYALLLMALALVVVLYMRQLSSGVNNTMNRVGTRMTEQNVPTSEPTSPVR